MDNGPKDGRRIQVGLSNEMAAFDRLSLRLRRMLNDAPRNFSAAEIQSMMLDELWTEDEVIEGLHAAYRA